LSKRFFSSQTPRVISVLAYGTTLSVLIYINRISPDSICILLILTAALFLFKSLDTKKAGGNYARDLGISATAAATACFSKAVFGVPALAAILAYLLFYKRFSCGESKINTTKMALQFAGIAIAISLLWSIKVDYRIFTNSWIDVISRPGAQAYATANNMQIRPNRLDVVLVCELAYFAISIIGGLLIIKKGDRKTKKQLALLLLIAILALPITYIKPAPHYFLVHLSVAAIPFAYSIELIIERLLLQDLSKKKKLVIGLLAVAMVHFTSMYFGYVTHTNHIKSYQKAAKPIYETVLKIDYDDRIATNAKPMTIYRIFGITDTAPQPIRDAMHVYFDFSSNPNFAGNAKYFIEINDGKAVVMTLHNDE
jgi:hypothetical protein